MAKRKRRPPQKNGKVSKPFIVGITAVFLLSFFSVFLVSNGTLVGNAVSVNGHEIGNVNLVYSNGLATLTADIGIESTNSVVVQMTGAFAVCDTVITNNLWSGFSDNYCSADKLTFSSATISDNNLKTGNFNIFSFPLPLTEGQEVEVTISSIEIYDLQHGDDLIQDEPFLFTLTGQPVDQAVVTPTKKGGGGGSGGGSCRSDWQCGAWNLCNRTLEQGRECVDLKNCNVPSNQPNLTQSCPRCQESWICGLWTSCQNGQQTRTCVEEHSCGTFAGKPDETKPCSSGTSLPPVKQVQQPIQPVLQQPEPSFWDQYKTWIILIPALLLIILLIILIIMHYLHKKHVVYNVDELKTWIKQERAAGTSNEDIREILAQQTGWSDEEIDNAFSSLKSNGVSVAAPKQ